MHFKKPTSKKNVYKDAKKLREIISEGKINTLAKESGWQKRERTFTAMDLLKTMVFTGHGHYQLSLRERCCELLSYGVTLSKQALDKRLNEKAPVFIKSVLEQVLQLKLTDSSMKGSLKDFTALKILDATSFQLPENLSDHYAGVGGSASKSGVKTHYRVAIATTDQMEVEITGGIGPDTATSLLRASPGELLLFDLGYFSFTTLYGIATDRAFYISRIKYNTQIWVKTGEGFERFNWQKQIREMQQGQLRELQVYLGRDKAVESRLIIEKLPGQIAHQKRRKFKADMRDKRKKYSKERLDFCAVNAFITNTAKEQLPACKLRAIYSIRWQIEIYFKTWKSYMNIDKIEKMNLHRFNCTHYASLIYVILSCKLFLYFKQTTWKKQHKELSELKAMKLLAKHRELLWELLYLPLQRARDRLEALQKILNMYCIKENKKGKLTPYQIIEKSLS